VYDKDMLLSYKFIVYWQIYTNCERGFPNTFKPHLRPVFSLFCSMLINLSRTRHRVCAVDKSALIISSSYLGQKKITICNRLKALHWI